MKESTGELSMTVITLLAIALIAGVVAFLVPLAQNYIEDTWGNITDSTPTTPTNPTNPTT